MDRWYEHADGFGQRMILSFGYLILRQLLHMAIVVVRGDRANEVEILVFAASGRGVALPGPSPGS